MIQPQYAQPYSQGTPSANAVNIQIFEPKAYASPQQAMQPNYTNPLYNYPQASLYGAPQMQYAPYPMAQPMYQTLPGYLMQQPQAYTPYAMPQQYPQYQQYAAPAAQIPSEAPQVVSPEPQPMPEPVITKQETEQTPAQPEQTTPAAQPEQAPVQQAAQTQEPAKVEVQPAPQPTDIDVNALVSGLQSTDPAVQEKAITEIANYSQGEPVQAQQVLNEQIMGSLADIVGADISKLQGPTPEQTAVFEKAAKGEQLTPEETQLAQQLSPQTAAAKNKIISMFTLAMLQKNQRDELDAYIASQGANNKIMPLPVQNLIGFNEIQNAIQNDANPEIRLAGIQAMSYIARPEDAQAIQAVLQNSLSDPEPLIQQAAQETLSKLGVTQQAPAEQQAQPQQQAA